jgi:hypothetical protein
MTIHFLGRGGRLGKTPEQVHSPLPDRLLLMHESDFLIGKFAGGYWIPIRPFRRAEFHPHTP